MANTNQEVQRLLKIIPFGKANAIHAKNIAQMLGYPTDGNQVETRQLIRFAIQQGNVIISTPNKGYWQSNNKQEVESYINALVGRADQIYNRSDKIKDLWNKANPHNNIL